MKKIFALTIFVLFFGAGCIKGPEVSYELYMGLSKPDGSTVSAEQYRQFLDETVTPLFPEGLSVFDVYGQYLSEGASKPISEKSKVLVIISEKSYEVEEKIRQIASTYKSRFDQESVMLIQKSVVRISL